MRTRAYGICCINATALGASMLQATCFFIGIRYLQVLIFQPFRLSGRKLLSSEISSVQSGFFIELVLVFVHI